MEPEVRALEGPADPVEIPEDQRPLGKARQVVREKNPDARPSPERVELRQIPSRIVARAFAEDGLARREIQDRRVEEVRIGLWR